MLTINDAYISRYVTGGGSMYGLAEINASCSL
jgi:hypothetical protein